MLVGGIVLEDSKVSGLNLSWENIFPFLKEKREFSISCKTMNCIMHLDCIVSEAVSQFLLVNQQRELIIALERRHMSTGRKIRIAYSKRACE